MLKLAVYLKDYKKECIVGPIFKFLEAIFELLLPTIMATIINEGVLRHDRAYVLRMGSVMLLIAFCGYGCALVCQKLAARASQGFGTVLRNALFDRIQSLSYSQVDLFGAPTLTNRLTNDVNQLQTWVAMSIRLVSRAPFIFLGSILMSFFLDAQLGFLLLASTPVIAGIIYVITKHASPLYRSYQKKLDALGGVVQQNLSGVRVIRAFSKTKHETERFLQANGSLTDNGLAIGWVSSFFNPLTSFVINWVIVFLLWAGAFHIDAGRLSQGQIIAFINYANQILLALMVMSNLIILLTKAMASAVRVNEVLETKPDMAEAPDEPRGDPSAPAVEFRDVSFGYHRTGEKALEHVNVVIGRGQTVGIIGGTGSGKSTFVNLIARFYDATSGAVLVDGVPVGRYPQHSLRRRIGMVPQRALLFSDTVADNIRWGGEDASDDAVEEAAAAAQADEFIRAFPRGYGEPIDRGGVNLSGGQRQRLTIARALVSKPELLILDDASSALDFLTDARLRKAIREFVPGQTVLLVSQRVGVVRDADLILVFEDGRIVGSGGHDELLRTCGTYRGICLSQLSEEEAAQ